ncbi:MAG TPA: DUF4181 domain-containing protein [Ureibacillus sp.]|nr:DUF4181 domain-containing protein [Ureibacillus sp.]
MVVIIVGDVFAKWILVLFIFGIFLFIINKFSRRWLKVEKKRVFSYNYVNDKHKKIERTIRIISIVLISISLFTNVNQDSLKQIWFLETHLILFVFIIASEIVRIIMEKRYADNKNDYIFSTIQLVVISIFLISVFSTDFFGLLV